VDDLHWQRRVYATVEVDDFALISLADANVVYIPNHAAFSGSLGERDLNRSDAFRWRFASCGFWLRQRLDMCFDLNAKP
jgi:hypothetical protein